MTLECRAQHPGRRSAVVLAASLLLSACGEAPAPKSPLPAAVREAEPTSWVCRGLIHRFLGLPAAAQGAGGTPPPLSGRWWVRGCQLGLNKGPAGKSELTVHLDGPGWYWIDFQERHLELHQQVPFELSADIAGSIRFAYSSGVASLWFEPTHEAQVLVNASSDLQLHGATAWGSLLRRIPLLPIRQMAAERLSENAAVAIRAQIQRGITVTYELGKGQSDMSFGILQGGETPRRVFDDGTAWIENDRLSLPAGATQVFGPLDPTPIAVDVVVEQGPGISYRALCTHDMAAQLHEIAAGDAHRISRGVIVDSGELLGAGSRSMTLHVKKCPYYLVVSSASRQTTVVALRLRAAAS